MPHVPHPTPPAQPHYLPRSRTHLRLLERAADPYYYLPRPLDATGNMYLFAPPGLAPELQAMFRFPSRRALIKAEGRERSPSLGADVEVEAGRRAASSVGHAHDDGFDVNERDFGGGGEGEEMDLGGFDYQPGLETDANGAFRFELDGEADRVGDGGTPGPAGSGAGAAKASQRNSKKQKTDGGVPVVDYEDAVRTASGGPLAVFDDARSGTHVASQTQTQTQTQQTQQTPTQLTQSLGEEEEEAVLDGGSVRPGKWSRNTLKALGVLRSELRGEEEGRQMEFGRVAEKVRWRAPCLPCLAIAGGSVVDLVLRSHSQATRRAAASFFFELLVLSTRDCVKIEQKEAYGAIHVAATDKLWDAADGKTGRAPTVGAEDE